MGKWERLEGEITLAGLQSELATRKHLLEKPDSNEGRRDGIVKENYVACAICWPAREPMPEPHDDKHPFFFLESLLGGGQLTQRAKWESPGNRLSLDEK